MVKKVTHSCKKCKRLRFYHFLKVLIEFLWFKIYACNISIYAKLQVASNFVWVIETISYFTKLSFAWEK